MQSPEIIGRELFEAMRPEKVKTVHGGILIIGVDDIGEYGGVRYERWSPTSNPAHAVACAEWLCKSRARVFNCVFRSGVGWSAELSSVGLSEVVGSWHCNSFPESLARAIHQAITKGANA